MESVVDLSRQVFGMKNLSVLNIGVLPTAGIANPTISMWCPGEALADRLRVDLGG